MTVKLYKKRIKWYFKYHGIEYPINMCNTLNVLEKTLNKDKVLYVNVRFPWHYKGIGYRHFGHLWEPNATLVILIKLLGCNSYENLNLPQIVYNAIDRYFFLEVLYIW